MDKYLEDLTQSIEPHLQNVIQEIKLKPGYENVEYDSLPRLEDIAES